MIARARRPVSPAVWILAPAGAAFAASLVLSVPLRVEGLQAPEPVFAFVPAFAWAMARPSILAPPALALLGLALDFLWGTPPGLWSVCLLVAYTLVFFARRVLAGQEVWALWVIFGAVSGAGMLSGFILTAFRAGAAPTLIGLGLQFLVTVALFPFAWMLLERYEAPDARF